ncbi:response regulator transcription factor [soil metagenome]
MASNMPIRLAIVNDYELVVSGLAAVLAPFSDRITVVEVDSQLPVISDVDILLYDTFGQAQGDALDIDSLMDGPTARVVVFSWNTDETLVEQAFTAGADAYVAKSVTAEQLVQALTRVHQGEHLVHVAPDGPEEAADRFGRWPGDRFGLSPREAEVLALVCQGLSNEEITQRAFIGINTVKTHIRTLYRKIDVTSRSQAVAWGLTHGFSASSMRTLPEA